MSKFELGEPVHDKPRFPGDPILCGTKYDVLLEGEVVAQIFEHPHKYEGGRASVNLNKIRWAGDQPNYLNWPEATLFHDFVSDHQKAEDVFPEVILRVNQIIEWRKRSDGSGT